MFSVDGNEAVHNLLSHLQYQFWEGIKAIKAKHPEVVHAGATEKIYATLKKFYHANPAELTTLKKESKIGDYVQHQEEVTGLLHDVNEERTEAIIKTPAGDMIKVKM